MGYWAGMALATREYMRVVKAKRRNWVVLDGEVDERG
jgi:hypothetical protein